jgi:hypothetical protein
MKFDADAAAALLNQSARPGPDDENDVSLDILHEGNLPFIHERGHARPLGGAQVTCLTESLYFLDGSRALRVKSPRDGLGWSAWTALPPPSQDEQQ